LNPRTEYKKFCRFGGAKFPRLAIREMICLPPQPDRFYPSVGTDLPAGQRSGRLFPSEENLKKLSNLRIKSMNKTSLSYMPIFVGDYIRDTQHLTTEEHGPIACCFTSIGPKAANFPTTTLSLLVSFA
jgi:hypothetical protein